jgi:hypothetical protein
MPAFDRFDDPFCFESVLSLPALSSEPSSAWHGLDLDEPHFNGVFKEPDTKFEGLQKLQSVYFDLPNHDVPLPEIESATVSPAPSDFDDAPARESHIEKDSSGYDGDIWTLCDVTRPQKSTALISWDCFLHHSHVEPRAIYLSEAGPAAFDTALEQALRQSGKHLPAKVVQTDRLISALFELGCGRQSGLFKWDGVRSAFVQTSGEFGILGTSQHVQHAFIRGFITTGNIVKGLLDFMEESALSVGSQHLVIALSFAVSVVIYATTRFLEQGRHNVQSLVQLQELFHKPRQLFERLTTLVKIAKSGPNASETIAKLTNEIQQLGNGAVCFEGILSEVMMRTATPWLDAMADVVGLSSSVIRQSALGDSRSPLADDSSSGMAGYSHVLPPEISSLVTECDASLRLLQVHEPDHPLLTGMEAKKWPLFSWECSWEAIEKLQCRADEYERGLKKEIQSLSQQPPEHDHDSQKVIVDAVSRANSEVAPAPDIAELVNLDSPVRRDQHLGMHQATDGDKLDHLVYTGLSTDEESLTLAPSLNETLILSISPLLKAQHRLLSCSVLHILFKTHGFRSHLRIHHRFQLLADGSFASRLSQALFDPDQSSGEGRRKGQGQTGLRLQTRDTWPPASSELRLVLMGILAESFASDSSGARQHNGSAKAKGPQPSEAMSFAIRELSHEELEKCRDADSIHALDFLRLQYQPHSALLEAVLNPASQTKYDRIFKHLLRLLRVRSVALSMIRSVSGRNSKSTSWSEHKFRVEMQFFISTLAEYSANVAVRSAWLRLEGLTDKVEKCLDRDDFDGAIAIAGGLQHLTEMHGEALRGMLRALCLDKRQVQVRTVLEDIFGLVLRTAALIRRQDEMTDDSDEKLHAMYKDFRKQVGRFIRYLQAQSNAAAGKGEALAFEQLLIRLNMFGYYG